MDLLGSLIIFAIYAVVFGCVHVPALRLGKPHRLLVFLMGTYALSAILSLLITLPLQPMFTAAIVWKVANLGGCVSGFFAAGLYAFLGPATADRSSAAQMLQILLRQHPNPVAPELFARDFATEEFMVKRLEEFRMAGLIEQDLTSVRMTPAGLRFARLYRLLQDGLSLKTRDEYVPYFRSERADD